MLSKSSSLQVAVVILLTLAMLGLGLLGATLFVDYTWPVSLSEIGVDDISALERLDGTVLMQASSFWPIAGFLAAMMTVAAGIVLPFAYVLSPVGMDFGGRFGRSIRESTMFGFWIALILWLQMNRILGLGIAFLSAAVLVAVELLVLLRNRTDSAAVGEREQGSLA